MKRTGLSNFKITNAALAVTSIFGVFIVWGAASGVVKKTTPGKTEQKAQQDDNGQEREALLSEVSVARHKDSDGESNVLFNDPFIQNKWGIEKTFANRAWEITQGSKEIVVAVIDTGIDVDHKGLSDNLWKNPGETGIVDSDVCRKTKNALSVKACNRAENGIDDDGNGFVDDVYGWNFVHDNNQLVDNHGHGTHIAGIIAAKGGSGGVTGVAPNVSVMVLKYFDPKTVNSNNLKNTIQAIRYAIKMKANIINYSGGGTDFSSEEFAAIKDAEKAGILFVAAAGNERSNSDEVGKHYYPADYELSNIISVTAVNKAETKVLPSSNYGVRTVDLAAPGEHIYSTLPGNTYGVMTGTSQATAFVTGVAALVLSVNRDFSSLDVKKYILRTGDEYSTLLSKTGTAKLLNSYKALASLDMGVSASGVVAANTARVDSRAFAADQSARNERAANVDNGEEPVESVAMFRDLLKAMPKEKK